VKSAVIRPLTYAAIFVALMLWRLVTWFSKKNQSAVRVDAAPRTTPASLNG
jgi:DMSO/TMAO reductase YedYZ heme-binding membrane subunit